MGIDTKLAIASKYGLDDVAVVLKTQLKAMVTRVELNRSCADHVMIHFALPNGEERIMHCHRNYNFCGFSATWLSLGCSRSASEIMQTIAKSTGGVFVEQDCSDDAITFDEPGNGNLKWVVQRMILEGKITGNERELIDAVEGKCKS